MMVRENIVGKLNQRYMPCTSAPYVTRDMGVVVVGGRGGHG
jgi:hypothetical protein